MSDFMALVNISSWVIEWVQDREGNKYQVEGYIYEPDHNNILRPRCPTEECGAACCKRSSFEGKVGQGPCRFLEEDQCSIQVRYGLAMKPISCMIWPKNPFDLEVNPDCRLRLVKWRS